MIKSDLSLHMMLSSLASCDRSSSLDPLETSGLKHTLRGTRNLSFVLRRSLLRTFETILILVITLECSNITASKSIRRERKMRPMELSGVNFSTHGSESECSCFDQFLCIRV